MKRLTLEWDLKNSAVEDDLVNQPYYQMQEQKYQHDAEGKVLIINV